MSSRHLQEVFKTFWRLLQDIFKTSFKNVFKTSSRHLQNLLQRYLQDVFKTYYQVRDLQKDLPRSHFWEIYGQCTKFARVIKISQVLVFHFTITFSGVLTEAYLVEHLQYSFFAEILNSFTELTISQKSSSIGLIIGC